MGEHGTWFDYLDRFEGWRSFNEHMHQLLGRNWKVLIFADTGFTLTHVLITLLVIGFCMWGCISFYSGLASPDQGMVPARKMSLRGIFEYLAEYLYGFVEGAMGEHNAARFFPLIGTLFMFIFFNNLIGLVPGFVAPTDTLKTNVGIAILVFLLTHILGVKEHGLAYFKHFLGPTLALAPLMVLIELVSHCARPMSLAIRLMGNMMADHKVVMAFFGLVPFLVPVPFMLLGLLVCYIQALVFCTLAMVYIGMAIEHEDDH